VNWKRRIHGAFAEFLSRRQAERELDAELRFHVERRAEELRHEAAQSGMDRRSPCSTFSRSKTISAPR